MKYLVTGSSGYIGSRLSCRLMDRGHTVVGLDREEPSYRAPDEFEGPDAFTQGDILDDGTLEGVFEGVDAVFHLAAAKGDWGISEEEYYRDNLYATEKLLRAGRNARVKKWVFYSTVSTMGPSEEPIPEDAGFDPVNPYGASKADAEKLFRRFVAEESDAQVLTIRPSVVYGPGNPSSTNVYRLIDAIYNRRFVMVGPGEAVKTTSYIHNLLAATFFLMDRMEEGMRTYTYVDEPRMTTGEMVEHIYRFLDRDPPSWHIPLSVARPIAYMSDVAAALTGIDLPITGARIEKFNRATNFDASAVREAGFEQPVSNEKALRRTVKWHLREQYGVNLPD
jgi:nucleoside-diphosphate-sugar epimerase